MILFKPDNLTLILCYFLLPDLGERDKPLHKHETVSHWKEPIGAKQHQMWRRQILSIVFLHFIFYLVSHPWSICNKIYTWITCMKSRHLGNGFIFKTQCSVSQPRILILKSWYAINVFGTHDWLKIAALLSSNFVLLPVLKFHESKGFNDHSN